MKKQVKIAIAAVIVLGFAGLVATRMMKPQEEMQTKGLPAVTLTTATEGSIEQTTALMGTVQPSDTYYITPKVAGELVEIYVQNGQSVEEGEPIAKIDNQKQIDAAKSQMEAANASVQAASQQAATAQDAVNRMTPLYESGDISVQSYNQTANSAKAAASQVDAAKAQAASAKLNYETQVEFATVTAPAAGVVQNQNMTLHGMVSQSSQLCVITGTGAKVVKFNVTEDVLQNLTMGQTVTVEKNGTSYSGTITKLTKLVNDLIGGLLQLVIVRRGDDRRVGIVRSRHRRHHTVGLHGDDRVLRAIEGLPPFVRLFLRGHAAVLLQVRRHTVAATAHHGHHA